MDDVVMLGNSKKDLKEAVTGFSDYVNDNLKLNIKPPVFGTSSNGVSFLGYRVSSWSLLLNGKSKRRFRHKLIVYNALLKEGRLSERSFHDRVNALVSFVSHARSHKFRKSCINLIEG